MIRHKFILADDYADTFEYFENLPFRLNQGDLIETKSCITSVGAKRYLKSKNRNGQERFYTCEYFDVAMAIIQKDKEGFYVWCQMEVSKEWG